MSRVTVRADWTPLDEELTRAMDFSTVDAGLDASAVLVADAGVAAGAVVRRASDIDPSPMVTAVARAGGDRQAQLTALRGIVADFRRRAAVAAREVFELRVRVTARRAWLAGVGRLGRARRAVVWLPERVWRAASPPPRDPPPDRKRPGP